jgi:hypothetical protein
MADQLSKIEFISICEILRKEIVRGTIDITLIWQQDIRHNVYNQLYVRVMNLLLIP